MTKRSSETWAYLFKTLFLRAPGYIPAERKGDFNDASCQTGDEAVKEVVRVLGNCPTLTSTNNQRVQYKLRNDSLKEALHTICGPDQYPQSITFTSEQVAEKEHIRVVVNLIAVAGLHSMGHVEGGGGAGQLLDESEADADAVDDVDADGQLLDVSEADAVDDVDADGGVVDDVDDDDDVNDVVAGGGDQAAAVDGGALVVDVTAGAVVGGSAAAHGGKPVVETPATPETQHTRSPAPGAKTSPVMVVNFAEAGAPTPSAGAPTTSCHGMQTRHGDK